MRIHDTLSRKKIALNAQKIRIYLCGVTAYDEAHIGHARTIIVFDVLRRHLESKKHRVILVQNFTDVDDKIISRADDLGINTLHLSEKYIAEYMQDSDALNIKRAYSYPKATDHIREMQAIIENLIKSGIAYAAETGVYFDVSKFPEYGALSGKKTAELLSGARVKIDEHKRNALDFALWKFADNKPLWPSPWGQGRPGWHIECSAMSLKYLGQEFEIHGGGRDLIFPHHENELAQSQSYTMAPLAQVWMHTGMVTINGEKMSKSMGNVCTIKNALDVWGANILRLFALSGHYSKPIDYDDGIMAELASKWRQLETAYCELKSMAGEDSTTSNEYLGEFVVALDDNLNTHMALDALFRLVKKVNARASKEQLTSENSDGMLRELLTMSEILGLCLPESDENDAKIIQEKISQRDKARSQKDYSTADAIRDSLLQDNIELVDHKSRTVWIKREKIAGES